MSADPRDGFDFFAPTPQPGSHPGGPVNAGTPSHLAPRTSRWAKSSVTFGPVGRLVATLLLVLPLLFLAAAGLFTFDPFVVAGAVVWVVLMAQGLRHVWQAVRVD